MYSSIIERNYLGKGMLNIKFVLLGAALTLFNLGYVNASLIDDGDYVLDTESNLQWLDLTLTNGMSYADAIAVYSANSWRYATASEYKNMFDSQFPLYSENTPFGYMSRDISNEGNQFLEFFGATRTNLIGDISIQLSWGFYENEAGNITRGGIEQHYDPASLQFEILYRDQEMHVVTSEVGNSGFGTFLVRDVIHSVPLPSVISLMFLGLVSFGLKRRRKKK